MTPRLPRLAVRATSFAIQRGVLSLPGPARVRRSATDASALLDPGPGGVHRTTENLGGVPAVRHVPEAAGDGPAATGERAVLYLHGGGFELGSMRTHRSFASRLAIGTGVPVHLLDYRLAPESRHPDALLDATAAYRALLAQGIESRNIVIGGDSAGAALALGAAIRLRDEGAPSPRLLVLLCPWLDLSLSGDSFKRNGRRDVGLSPGWLRHCAEIYAPDHSDKADPEISPLHATLTGLPAIHVQEAADDMLADDASALTRRAAAAGVEVDHRRYEGVWHGFQLLAGALPEARSALEDAAQAVRAALEPA